jgi:hypothetical protein
MEQIEITQNWKIVEKIKHKMDDACWVKAIAEILQVETGAIARYETDEIFQYGAPHPIIFNWAENNFSCDCNRHLFFYRAFGDNPDSLDECTDGKYLVRLSNPVNGEVYYDEFPFSNYFK